jgi:butyrate kinase
MSETVNNFPNFVVDNISVDEASVLIRKSGANKQKRQRMRMRIMEGQSGRQTKDAR